MVIKTSDTSILLLKLQRRGMAGFSGGFGNKDVPFNLYFSPLLFGENFSYA